MKLKQQEVNAIVQTILKECESAKILAEKDYKESLEADERFEEIAKLLKEKFSGEFYFVLSIWRKDLDEPVKKLANILRESYFNEHFDEKKSEYKSENYIANEVIMLAPHHTNYDSIVAAINPKKPKTEE